ncbi:MAG: peptide ABC transporter substrate-binding protein [Anaerovoracaceae bacterium]
MKKKIFACFLAMMLIMSLFTACGGSGGAEGEQFRALYSSDVATLNYLNTTTTGDMEIPANTEEWLIQYDSVGNIQPALAESWTTSDDGLVWTFKIRDDAKWYDCKGEEVGDVTAQDFVNAAEYALKYDAAASYMFPAAKIKNSGVGYDVLISGEVPWEEVGIKAIDDKTLEFTLEAPTPYFLSCLTYGCFAPAPTGILNQFGDWDNRASWTVDDWNAFSEGLDGVSYDQMWYCGAYYLSEYNAGERYTLKKNPNYFEADQVYIETLSYIYNAEAATLSGEMFQRGEVESASITSTQAKSWSESEETKDLYTPVRVLPDYSYFWSFNFNPQFDEEYEPDNWTIAVNNENFRKSLMYSINRIGVIKISDELNAETLLQNTITPANFVAAAGTDYVDQQIFKDVAVSDGVDAYFNADLAKECRDKAKKELEAAGATFPVKILMVYNPAVSDWDAECVYMEKQMEELLGTDYIDIIVEQGPTQSFLAEVRRSGKYAMLKTNYGCDYADPLTYADPFTVGNNYAFMDTSTAPETKAVVDEYYKAVAKADAITEEDKMAERYAAFAEAEAMLIEHAIAVPCGLSGGYSATKVNPFEGQYAPYGVSTLRYKGQHIMETAMSTDMFNAELAKWEEARMSAAQ